ncbi:hypothetical protein [Flavobacterium beibuense]|uniref:YcxB-like protein domain-containing protein n=1 Tax=Flavobacterium beibuense TaxID=657326 RepID=A0A444WA65_9FLAO|nr:hypothetical protein [Flavobacterium beibuense]RYJ42546.1 hypothetical protein NU09_2332 [Flavobacterium beibuense]
MRIEYNFNENFFFKKQNKLFRLTYKKYIESIIVRGLLLLFLIILSINDYESPGKNLAILFPFIFYFVLDIVLKITAIYKAKKSFFESVNRLKNYQLKLDTPMLINIDDDNFSINGYGMQTTINLDLITNYKLEKDYMLIYILGTSQPSFIFSIEEVGRDNFYNIHKLIQYSKYRNRTI